MDLVYDESQTNSNFNVSPEKRKQTDIQQILKVTEDVNLNTIKETWKFSFLSKYPKEEVRNYFGERVCLYYEFMELYTRYLFFLGLLGIGVYIVQLQDGIESHDIEFFGELGFHKSDIVIGFNTMYSFVVIVWSTLFLEHWKRKEAAAATVWGQTDFEINEQSLPSYTGKKRRSPANDVINTTFYPSWKRIIKIILSYIISLILIVAVIVIVMFLLYWRNDLVINRVWGANNKFLVNVPSNNILIIKF